MSKEMTIALKRDSSSQAGGSGASNGSGASSGGNSGQQQSAKDIKQLKLQLQELQQALSALGGQQNQENGNQPSSQQNGSQQQEQQKGSADSSGSSGSSSSKQGGQQLADQVAQFSSIINQQQQNALKQLQQCIQEGVEIMNLTNQYFQAYHMLTQMQLIAGQTKQQMYELELQAQQNKHFGQMSQQSSLQ